VLPHTYASEDNDEVRVGFQETKGSDTSSLNAEKETAGGEQQASAAVGSALSLARRRQHARQGTREFVRGKAGSMPFMPGGEGWNAAGNPAAAAAAEDASSGAWLRELEQGFHFAAISKTAPIPKALAPGMSRGAFGAWQSSDDEGEGKEEDAASLAVELRQLGLQEPTGAATAGAGEEKKADKVAVEDLFSGVWMPDVDEEEEEQQGSGLVKLEDLDKGEDEAETGEAEKENDEAAAKPRASDLLFSGSADNLASSLPSDIDLPGGVESVTAALDLTSSTTWLPNQSPLASPLTAAAISASSSTTTKHSLNNNKDRKTWAVRGTVKNLDSQWKALQPGLAKRYPFELDIFQKEAIIHMEAGHSVFVAAHTSAGKTAAAEYAFALASTHCTRAIYTSPIKTISNQKFRDFSGQFDVGLLTGDVSIRPDSSCLIMTTEILRSMLYKGADIIRDIEWVVFDEVHYVNDVERGVVWEEVIIMLPEHVNLVLLSATVPNVMEFADWVGRTKRKVVHVTGTLKRPVPLEHSIYYGGKLYTVCTAEVYEPRGFRLAREPYGKKHALPQTKAEAKAALPTGRGDGGGGRGGGGGGGATRGRGGSSGGRSVLSRGNHGAPSGAGGGGGGIQLRGERNQWSEIITSLKKQDLLPMVAFCFSKKRCDAIADALHSLDMTTATEKSEIHVFCDKALARLKGSDRELPQVLRIREMLKRGVGVHHAGLLPIVKEVVEMLFCRGVIKVLFSTETFAMGVNAPARSVIFQALRKHDGSSFRTLLPGEYTQMAGRAGRRGLDPIGTVIIAAWDDLPEETDVRRLLTGAATKLESQFRLTYSMILNLLRVEDLKVEDMLKRSFAEFHSQRAAPEAQIALKKGQDALRRLRARPWPISPLGTTREEVEKYAEIAAGAESLGVEVQDAVMGSRGASSALVNGRVVLVVRKSTGVSELGVVLDVSDTLSNSSSISGFGGRRIGGGVGIGSGNAAATDAAAGAGGSRKQTSSITDTKSQLPGIGAGGKDAMSTLPEAAPAPMMMLKKKDDDDDMFLGMKAIGKGKGGGKGKGKGGSGLASLGGKGTSASTASKFAPPLALPHQSSIGGTSFLLSEVSNTDILGICKVKIRVDADAIATGDAAATAAAVNSLLQVQEENNGTDPPLMDPISDLKINSIEVAGAVRERQRLLATLSTLPPHRDPFLPEMLAIVRSERLLVARMAALARQSGDAGLAQLPEFHQRVGVLQHMGYLDSDRTVTMKGRVACEINSGDEFVATELIFGGVLTDLSPEEAVSLLSELVFQEKSEAECELPSRLVSAKEESAALAYSAGVVQQDAGLQIVPEEYVKSTLNFGLMEVVYEWAQGTPFNDICRLTDVMEGSIVRTIVRLDETCREFRDAARVMGNTALFQQMEEASQAIKRDIVFAASLYVA
jgi:antiviral helicase SKI2